MRVGDLDRDRAAATLREQYAEGRLTLDELSERTDHVLAARSRAELETTLFGLSWIPRAVAARGRSLVEDAVRVAMLVVVTGTYLLFSAALLLVLAVTTVVGAASASVLAVFVVVWLVPTLLVARLWHHRSPLRRRIS